jgi:hypothetical protein
MRFIPLGLVGIEVGYLEDRTHQTPDDIQDLMTLPRKSMAQLQLWYEGKLILDLRLNLKRNDEMAAKVQQEWLEKLVSWIENQDTPFTTIGLRIKNFWTNPRKNQEASGPTEDLESELRCQSEVYQAWNSCDWKLEEVV